MHLLNTSGVYLEKAPERWIAIARAALQEGIAERATWYGAIARPYRDLTATAAKTSDDRIDFPGSLPHEAILQLLAMPTSVLLISSDIEVFPMSIMEATRAGTPVVCRRFRGWVDVLGADYPYAYDTTTEALAALATIGCQMQAARRASRHLFEARFLRTEAWAAAIRDDFGRYAGQAAG